MPAKPLYFIIPVLMLLVVFAAFSPVLKNDFTNWDDDVYVTENPQIKVISPATIKTISTSFFMGHYHPLTLFSYMLEYKFFKLNPFVYHLDNLILHLLNCLLVFWLFYLLSSNLAIAAIVSLLFGIHPMQVESVAWVSERKNLLYAFFYLGALISYIYYLKYNTQPQPQPPGYTGAIPLSARYKPQPIYRYYYLCLILFFLSLLSKSMAITLPLVLLLLDYYLLPKLTISSLVKKIPFFILSGIFGVVALWESRLANTIVSANAYGLLDQFKGISYDIVFYLSKIIFPLNLSALYPLGDLSSSGFIYYTCLVTFIFLAALVINSRKLTKKIIFGSGLFFLIILPAVRFLPVKEMIRADRYVYLACLGIFFLLIEGGRQLYVRGRVLTRVILICGLSLGVICLGVLTWQRSRVWNNSFTLWNDVLAHYPENATAYNGRGEFYLKNWKLEKARPDFTTAISLDPAYYEAYFNLASLEFSMSNYEAAAKWAKKSLAINPQYLKTYNLLAAIYGAAGNYQAVINICDKLISIRPDMAEPYINLSGAYGDLWQFAQAIAYGKKALAIDPGAGQAHMNLAAAYYYTGQYGLAREHSKKAAESGYSVPQEFLRELEKGEQKGTLHP